MRRVHEATGCPERFAHPERARKDVQKSILGPFERSPLRKIAVAVAKRVAIVLAVLLVAGLIGRQTGLLDRHFIFFPDRDLVGTPADLGLAYEDVHFTASDGVDLNGWFVPGESAITLLWLHGNAGNISHRLENLRMIRHWLRVSVFIFDYRGYGASAGSPSEAGTYRDAEAAMEYLRTQQDVDPEENLVVFGRSLGAAVAVDLASRHRVRAVILESPFTSVRSMAQQIYPYLPIGMLIRMVAARYDSLSKIKAVDSPVMVLHGDRDDTVPMENGLELFDAANEPKRFYAIEGAGHNDTYLVGGAPYFEALGSFIKDPDGDG
jgi:fermentation-respiration switch protein FrsA (DUF1100 family)